MILEIAEKIFQVFYYMKPMPFKNDAAQIKPNKKPKKINK